MPAASQSLLRCEDVLYTAERQFFNARFDEASGAIEQCLAAYIFQEQELIRAKILLARIYFASRQEGKAREAITEVLALDPEYRATPPLPPPYIAFVDTIREARDQSPPYADRLKPAPVLEEERSGVRSWVWIGSGALIAGTAAVLLTGGSAGSGFPPPPGPPSR